MSGRRRRDHDHVQKIHSEIELLVADAGVVIGVLAAVALAAGAAVWLTRRSRARNDAQLLPKVASTVCSL